MTKYADREKKLDYMKQYVSAGNPNPFILCMFVEIGNENNRELTKIITDKFKEESIKKDWKSKIMFSKWWLPLMKIRMVDSYNYYNIMQGEIFPSIIKDLTKIDE